MKSYFFVLWPKLFLSNSIVKSLSQLLFFMPFVTWISSFSFTFFLFSLAISSPSKNHSIGTRSAASWTLFGNISCFPSVAMCPLFIYLICDTLLVLLLDSIQAYFLHLFWWCLSLQNNKLPMSDSTMTHFSLVVFFFKLPADHMSICWFSCYG